ncbi:MAG: sigma-70 family RNA polymerase sigma factor [Planctomycetes bacterium]|nr:sigma-70 family RNA polymerase sigma factor [Planctomycetota bacterium]
MQHEEVTDEAIVQRVQAGDTGAFETLISRHRESVFRIVERHVPRDRVAEIAHEAFVSAYLSLRSFRPTHPFEHWLARIARRCCCDFWRERGRERDLQGEPRAAGDERPRTAALEIDPRAGSEAKQREAREILEWAFARLPLDDRLVLALVYFEELSVKECAQVLDWGESKVKVRAHRARERLRRLLASLAAEDGKRP